MRVSSIITNLFIAKNDFRNNPTDYSQYRVPVLNSLTADTFERVSFTGSKKVNPSRKVFDDLPQNELICPCCGRKMIPAKEIWDLKNTHALNCKAPQAIKVLQKYEENMHSVEKEVFEILKQEAKKHPNKNIKEILKEIKPQYEEPLIKTQFGIFALLEKASDRCDPKTRQAVKELIDLEKIKIFEGNNEFRRKYFVNQFEKIFEDYEDTSVKEHLIRIATKLPTAYEDKNAFIVKYANSKRSAEMIGLRLLEYSTRTIEHVTPQNKNGENHLFNYIPECMRCNSFRQDRSMVQQLEEFPEMFANAQKSMDILINFANRGMLNKLYIIKIRERILKESEGLLDIDISNLEMSRKLEKEYNKFEKVDKVKQKTVTKPTHKTKKEKRREALKIQHENQIKQKNKKAKKR